MAATGKQYSYTAYCLLIGLLYAKYSCADPWTKIQMSYCNPDHIPQLTIDNARLTLVNDRRLDFSLGLFTQSEECHKCELHLVTAQVQRNCTILVDTRWPTRLEVRLFNGSHFLNASANCSEARNTYHFQEGGNYAIFVQVPNNEEMECNLVPMNNPTDSNIPIFVALGIAVFLSLLWASLKSLYRRGYLHKFLCFWTTESVMSDFGPPISINPTEETSNAGGQNKKVTKERLRSLDTFRGISIVIMIFVNYRGGYYWFFRHSKWNGLTVADLVFPWFVFIMGTALILSFQSQLRFGAPKKKMLWKILRRSLILFALGLLINSHGCGNGVDMSQFRIPGVLQRFALTYLIVASIHLLFSSSLNNSQEYGRFAVVWDIVMFWPEGLTHVGFVMVHTCITFLLPVPNCPTGYIGPGGDDSHGSNANCTGGAAGYIDREVFGDSHIYQSPTCKEIYRTTVPYDPEGLLGILTSCFLCFLGLQAGKILFVYKDWIQRCWRFLTWGLLLCLLGGILCKFSKDDGWIPINKNLWSLSFVVTLAGMGFILLLACYLLVDVYKVWSGAPFYYPGMNSIVLYVGHELLSGQFPVAFDVPETHAAQLAMNIWGTFFWVIVAYYLDFKNIYISV